MTPSNPKVYLAGPMTGHEDFNRPAFAKAAAALRSLGLEVVCPPEITPDLDSNPALKGEALWQACMRRVLREMLLCTHVLLLDGWKGSVGANIEGALAARMGLEVYTLSAETVEAITLAKAIFTVEDAVHVRELVAHMVLRGVPLVMMNTVLEMVGNISEEPSADDHGLRPSTMTYGPIQ